MKRINLGWGGAMVLLVLGLVAPMVAQQAPATDSTHHSLWKVEGKHATVYLLGSVHVLKPEDYPLPRVMESAFTNAATLAFETDIGALEQLDTQMKVLSKGQLPAGETLSGQLSPAVYARFTNHLASTGLPGVMFERLKPSLAAMTLMVMEYQKAGLNPEYGLDKHFYNEARQAHKPVVGLETVDFQIGLLTDFTKEEGELLMKCTLEDIDKTKKDLGEMLKAWQTGDASGLEKLLNEASREAPAIFKRLVADRNQRWVPQIETWLGGDQNVLVVVGAGHLVGKDGVVELLRKKGLKVVQE